MTVSKGLLTLCLLLFTTALFAQRVHWPIEADGTYLGRGLGVPGVWEYKYSNWAITYEREGTEDAKLKRKDKDPGVIHLTFAPLDIQQVCVVESYNPGALAKVEIGYRPKGSKDIVRQEIYDGSQEERHSEFRSRNFIFDRVEQVTEVWLYVNYVEVPGPNQYAGVAICESAEPYEPDWNLPPQPMFTDEVLDINDDVSGRASPRGFVFLSANGHYIYFPHDDARDNNKIFRGTIGGDGKLLEVAYSDFNLPDNMSTSSGLMAVAQDGNVAYVSSMDLNKFNMYKVYYEQKNARKGKWRYDKNAIPGYENKGQYLDFVMSYDGQVVIVATDMEGDKGIYGRDMYVSMRSPKGKWSPLKRMGDDINSIESDIPCFLAPDNRTLYFSSNGRIGYGRGDIYVSRRLDDSWTNWSEPINLGPEINSERHENAFTLDPSATYAYFTRYKETNDDADRSDIFRINIRQPEPEPTPVALEDDNVDIEPAPVVVPDPVVLITGKVTNKSTGDPIQAEIIYEDINTGELLGTALSSGETGEYAIMLRKGVHYSFEAKAIDFLSDRHSLNTSELARFEAQEQDFALAPIEKGESIVLNNIFFETAKAELLSESYLELDKLVEVLVEYKKLIIEIGGHTDNVGKDSYNQDLSQRRAQAVVDYLQEKGIEASRLQAKGYGESQPVADNETEEGRSQNRRVAFTILED